MIWPRTCEICGRAVDRPSRYICSDCLNRIPFTQIHGCCRRCGRPASGLDVEYLCEECRVSRPSYDRAASAVRYEGEASRLVVAFKFKSRLWLKADFADWLEGVTRARFLVDRIDVVLPVPSTASRRWNRGYNQCVLLARALARRLGRPYGGFVLRRKGSPRQQRGLTEEERVENVAGTFAVMRPAAVKGRTVLLVDDVMTTGSTLSEAAAELKRAGAKRVWCVSLARSIR